MCIPNRKKQQPLRRLGQDEVVWRHGRAVMPNDQTSIRPVQKVGLKKD